MGLTKYVLKRPVTTVLAILCLVVFGLSSVTSSKLELIPEMNMPMMLVSTVYPGASPKMYPSFFWNMSTALTWIRHTPI